MIKRIDPPDWEHANTVQLDSDAPDNMAAMHEIEQWAAEHGFARTTEYWLRQAKTSENSRIFRGICYRLALDELAMAEEINRRVEERMSRMHAQTITA